jgi:hypothetical protein
VHSFSPVEVAKKQTRAMQTVRRLWGIQEEMASAVQAATTGPRVSVGEEGGRDVGRDVFGTFRSGGGDNGDGTTAQVSGSPDEAFDLWSFSIRLTVNTDYTHFLEPIQPRSIDKAAVAASAQSGGSSAPSTSSRTAAATVLWKPPPSYLAWPSGLPPVEHSAGPDSSYLEVFENQRRAMVYNGKGLAWSWGSSFPGHLLLSDPGRWSNRDCTVSTAKFDPYDGWQVDLSIPGCDAEGWKYNITFETAGDFELGVGGERDSTGAKNETSAFDGIFVHSFLPSFRPSVLPFALLPPFLP